jgi:hypothetical protein
MGVRRLLWRHHDCELAISLYPANRFLSLDYSSFDCGGMAFNQAGFQDPVVTVW